MKKVFEIDAPPSLSIHGSSEVFPIHRIYCVGRNYAAHTREMGGNPDRDPPFFFSKPADTTVANGQSVSYPPRTGNLHHEIELVVALKKGGSNISVASAEETIYGYAVGNDLTRRDLQAEAKEKGRPWDTAKGFDCSAPISSIYPVSEFGHIREGTIWIKVNGELRQEGSIEDMIWSVPEIIAELSTLYELRPGDIIFTGTPAGVNAVSRGDTMEGYIEGLETLVTRIE